MPTGNQSASLVTAAKPRSAAGSVFSAPKGTPIPTDPFTELPEAFRSLGYVSEDGITNGIESDSESITAFGGDTVLTIKTSHQETFVFRPIEKNEAVLAETWGQDNVEMVDDEHGRYLRALHTSKDAAERVYVFELSLNGNRVERLVVPNGKVTEIGENAMVTNDAQGHELTISASADDAGVTAYEYIAAVADEADPNVVRPTVMTGGEKYGKDVSTFGTFAIEGDVVSGTANKITGYTQFNKSNADEQEGYYLPLDITPGGIKVYKTPGGQKSKAKAIDDGFLVVHLGKDDIAVTDLHFINLDGTERTYSIEITKAQ